MKGRIMKIKLAQHKAILNSLFYSKTDQVTKDGSPLYQPKQFPFEKLMTASSAAKKLNKGSKIEDNKIFYEDGEIELNLDETIILKELFDANKDLWTIVDAPSVLELQELFEGKVK